MANTSKPTAKSSTKTTAKTVKTPSQTAKPTPEVAHSPTTGNPQPEKVEAKPVVGNNPAQPTAPAKATKERATQARKESATTASSEDAEPTDRLPTSIEELKATKGGLVSFLFLNGQDRGAIAAQLKVAFNLSEAQALKITRRITGRARFFRRAFDLVAAK